MNPILQEILNTGCVSSPDGSIIKVHSAVSCEDGKFLQELIFELKPTVTLEIGLAFGVSALFICDALEKTSGTKHIIIDPDQIEKFEGIGLRNLKAAGYSDMVEFYNLPSYRALSGLEAEGRKVNIAFIDGWHTFDYVLVDFFFIDKMLEVGGIVVFDDANWPSIRKVCRYIATNQPYSVYKCTEPIKKPELSFKRRIFNNTVVRSLKIFDGRMRILRPEAVRTDIELGLHGGCIAFRKESEDRRRYDEHIHF